jgi:hypothetical protein
LRKYRLVHRTNRGSVISLLLKKRGNTYLGERLAEHDLMTLSNEVSDGERISLNVSRSESLVCLLVSALSFRGRVLTMSKRARCFFDLTNSDSSFHCSWVGSIPVGFWAQAWSRNYYQLLPTTNWK